MSLGLRLMGFGLLLLFWQLVWADHGRSSDVRSGLEQFGVAGDLASLHSDGNNLAKQTALNAKGEAFPSRRQSETQQQSYRLQ
jgi:hypothetical protein